MRAVEILQPLDVTLDEAARDYADARVMLAGKATLAEVCRDWLKRNAVELPRVTVAAAAEKLKKQAETDGKSNDRQKQLAAALDALTAAFNCEVHTLTTSTHAFARWQHQSQRWLRLWDGIPSIACANCFAYAGIAICRWPSTTKSIWDIEQ